MVTIESYTCQLRLCLETGRIPKKQIATGSGPFEGMRVL